MKRIKLFESFEVLNPKEVMEDIKSIIYELEEYGFDISLGYYNWDSKNGFWSRYTTKQGEIDSKYILIEINNSDEIISSHHQDDLKLKTFMNKLKSHLDYIDTKKIMDRGISKYQSGRKRFYICLK